MAAMTTSLILNSWETDEYYFNNLPDPRVLEARVKKSRYNADIMRTIFHLTLPLAVPSKHNSGKQ
jgi:hypothetical protein